MNRINGKALNLRQEGDMSANMARAVVEYAGGTPQPPENHTPCRQPLADRASAPSSTSISASA
jgi:hypothetical protein